MNITSLLTHILSLNHIYQQPLLMAALTPQLTISCDTFSQIQPLKSVPPQKILSALQEIAFVKLIPPNLQTAPCQLQLSYPHLDRTVFVSGFSPQLLQTTLAHFCQSFQKLGAKLGIKGALASITARNDTWLTLLCAHSEVTSHLQRFLRVKKKNEQGRMVLGGRQAPEKVRIVPGDENLFAFLIDMVAEYKSRLFFQQIKKIPLSSGLRKSEVAHPHKQLITYKLMFAGNRDLKPPTWTRSQPQHNKSSYYQNQQIQHTTEAKPTQQCSGELRMELTMDSTSQSSERNPGCESIKQLEVMLSIPPSSRFVYQVEEEMVTHPDNCSEY